MVIKRDILSLNQIAFASQFVDAEVERNVLTFHQYCASGAGSILENEIASPQLTVEDLERVEFYETRLSHLSSLVASAKVKTIPVQQRPGSLWAGSGREIKIEDIFSLLSNSFGSYSDRRRPYPSGGALYSVEVIVILGEAVDGAEPYSVLHYLPESSEFEVIPSTIDKDYYDNLHKYGTANFIILYAINLRKAIFKYRSRGYRLALMEIGAMYQQATLQAAELGVGSRVLAGFQEFALAKRCGIDGRILLPSILHIFGFEGKSQ